MDFKQTLKVLCESAPCYLEELDTIDSLDGWNIVNVRKAKADQVGFWCYTAEGKYDYEGPFRSPKECKIWINKQ